MKTPKRILVFQTAFLGDVILTLPMIQMLYKKFPDASIDVVTTPIASELLANHPAISTVIPYDKRKSQKGIAGILSLLHQLRKNQYDLAIVPHRSLRSAIVIGLSGIKNRISFSTSSGSLFYNHIVHYEKSKHEIERNLSLITPLDITVQQKEFPSLYPSTADNIVIDKFLFDMEILEHHSMIAIAPGSVWKTKRWLLERFSELSLMLASAGYEIVIIGGKEDSELGRAIIETAKHKSIHDATGKFSLLQSAELIRRCKTLVTNDSAPLHIGVAMRTPIVAIFGATVPEFGFGPYGKNDIVVETKNLPCRPCAIHGGNECPIGTFVCMKNIEAGVVAEKVKSLITI
ncbi:MAG: lipopolysaccharide heptosyltransferase II [Bacteroidota bacterium]|nr:lipopolysaccharide heptosyltransferase II [Bacteroidota bacterium]